MAEDLMTMIVEEGIVILLAITKADIAIVVDRLIDEEVTMTAEVDTTIAEAAMMIAEEVTTIVEDPTLIQGRLFNSLSS